jgi:hypothetical protein
MNEQVRRWLSDPLPIGRRPHGVRVTWSEQWTPHHDDALDEVVANGGGNGFGTDVWRALAEPTDAPKRHAIVSLRGACLAVITLRRRGLRWSTAADLVLAFPIAATIPGMLGSALVALGCAVTLNEVEGDTSEFGSARRQPFDVYTVDLMTDFESHWRDGGHQSAVDKALARTSGLQFVGDDRDALPWAIDRWGRRWEHDAERMATASDDRRQIWPMLAASGSLAVCSLRDESGGIVAARVALERDGVLFDQVLERDREHPNQRWASTSLEAASYRHWSTTGRRLVDLGGYHDYKGRWGPVTTARQTVHIDPWRLTQARRAREHAAALRRRLRSDIPHAGAVREPS